MSDEMHEGPWTASPDAAAMKLVELHHRSIEDEPIPPEAMGYEEFCQHLELCTEKVVVVHLADGDTITTRIHGTDEDIRAYYRVGSVLNMGAERDRLVEVVGQGFIHGEHFLFSFVLFFHPLTLS